MSSANSPQSRQPLDQGRRGKEFCRSAGAVHSAGSPRSQLQFNRPQRWLTSISTAIQSAMPGQRVVQECWGSAQRWLTSTSATIMASALSGKGGFELRGVVNSLAFFCRRLALLPRCHLFSRQATRNSDILCTCSAVAFGLALSLGAKEV